MDAESAITADEQDRRRLLFIQLLYRRVLLERKVLESFVKTLEMNHDSVIVPPDNDAESDQDRRQDQRDPTPIPEFFEQVDDQYRHAEYQSDEMDRDVSVPVGILHAMFYPITNHAHFGERERQEDIDGIHKDQC